MAEKTKEARGIRIITVLAVSIFIIHVLLSLAFDKGYFVLWANDHRSAAANFFFRYATFLGDGIFFTIVALLFLCFGRLKYALTMLICGILQLFSVGFFKKVVFEDLSRPLKYFGDSVTFNLVPHVDVHASFSFPSGHTTTAFGLATLLAWIFRSKPIVGIIAYIMALIAGYSRIYLLQHFMMDVAAGIFLGILCALLSIRMSKLYNQKTWAHKRLISL